MKSVLITGARGFIGRHLALSLQRQGIQVCGIGHGAWDVSDRTAWGLNYWLNGEVTKHNLDIIQSKMGKPDVVFHLAGGSSVGPSLLAPEEDFRRSVLSSEELLEWARLAAPDVRLVLASSAAVYGVGHSRAIREIDVLEPYSPYGYHKRIAEQLFESYGKNFDLKIAVVRLFSVYGPELRKQLLWDACGRLAVDARRLTLYGSGDEMRDWFHISDAIEFLCIIANSCDHGGFIVNGGTGIAVSVREIAEQLCVAWGMGTQLEFNGKSRQGDPQYLVANIGLVTSLGFTPQVVWQEGLADYVKWFKRINS
jgi:UDP-glucose 4-epimerase